MTAIQMNAELLRNMSIIAEDEHLLKRAAKYLRKLVAEKEDSSLMTEEEFFTNKPLLQFGVPLFYFCRKIIEKWTTIEDKV